MIKGNFRVLRYLRTGTKATAIKATYAHCSFDCLEYRKEDNTCNSFGKLFMCKNKNYLRHKSCIDFEQYLNDDMFDDSDTCLCNGEIYRKDTLTVVKDIKILICELSRCEDLNKQDISHHITEMVDALSELVGIYNTKTINENSSD